MRKSQNPKLDAKIVKRLELGNSTSKIVNDIPGATRYRVQQVRYTKKPHLELCKEKTQKEFTYSTGAATERYIGGSGALGIHSEHYAPTWQSKFIKGFAYAFGAALLFILGLSLF